MQTGSPLVNVLGNRNKQGEKQSDTKMLPQIPGPPVQPLCRRREDEGGCACSVLPKPVPDIFPLAREHLGVNGKGVSCFLLMRHLSACAQKVLPWAKSPKPHKSCHSNNMGSDPHSWTWQRLRLKTRAQHTPDPPLATWNAETKAAGGCQEMG